VKTNEKILVGWREWVNLPDLGLVHIKSKIDTGARTSALSAIDIEPYHEHGQSYVKFHVLIRGVRLEGSPFQAPIADKRWIKSSIGHRQARYVIWTQLQLGDLLWPIEMTLASREKMLFPLLLGRTALSSHVIIDPSQSYLLGG